MTDLATNLREAFPVPDDDLPGQEDLLERVDDAERRDEGEIQCLRC